VPVFVHTVFWSRCLVKNIERNNHYVHVQGGGNVKCYECVSTLSEHCTDPFPGHNYVSTCTGDVCYKGKYETGGQLAYTLFSVDLSEVVIIYGDLL